MWLTLRAEGFVGGDELLRMTARMLSSFFCAHRSCGNFIIAVLLPHFQAAESTRSTYSAPGYRSSGSGVLGGNGLEGSIWSISANEANSTFLAFYPQHLNPTGSTTVLTVFRCVASRNKRAACLRWAKG